MKKLCLSSIVSISGYWLLFKLYNISYMRKLRLAYFLFTCILHAYTSTAQNTSKSEKIIGTYIAADDEHPDNVSHIKIYKASNGKYYGEIIWLKKPKYPDGKEKVDRLNPEKNLRNRKLIGLKMLNDFKFDNNKDEWNDGTIYNPANGKTYNAFITLKGPDKLHVRGYIGKAWMGLGKTVEWTRLK